MSKKQTKKRSRGEFIGIGIIVAIAIGIGVAAYVYSQSETSKFGAVGSTHQHGVILIMVHGKQVVDFSEPKYQLRSDYIHFESRDGYTVHLHATNVDLGFLFKSLKMEFNNECLKLDDGTSYCNDGTNRLKFYVNYQENDAYDKYVLKDGDRILMSYGPDDQEQIEREFNVLRSLEIRG